MFILNNKNIFRKKKKKQNKTKKSQIKFTILEVTGVPTTRVYGGTKIIFKFVDVTTVRTGAQKYLFLIC